jgi:putative membrane protein insertion efficiency factor
MGRGKGRRALLIVAAVWIVHDLAVPPRYAVDAQAAIFAIDAYRARVSPHIGQFVQCRFTPTCSWYGRESIRKYGFMRGGMRAALRIARCGPWTPLGTRDAP